MNKLCQRHIILEVVMVLTLWGCSSDKSFLGNTTFFFWNDYALYVNHPKYGMFVVNNKKVLKENRSKVKIKRAKGVINFLPTGVDRGYGLTLFKNGKPIKSYTHDRDNFTIFEIGALAQHSKSVNYQAFSGNKVQVQKKLEELSKQKHTYILNAPTTYEPESKESYFTLTLPSIAVPTKPKNSESTLFIPVETDRFNEGEWEGEWKIAWEQKIERRIRKIMPSIGRYELNVGFLKTPTQILQDYTNKALFKIGRGENLCTPNNEPIKIPYRFYTPEIRIYTSPGLIDELHELDYSSLITEEERSRPQLLQSIQEAVEQSEKNELSVEKGEVGLWGYNDKVCIGSLRETKYEVGWLEVKE